MSKYLVARTNNDSNKKYMNMNVKWNETDASIFPFVFETNNRFTPLLSVCERIMLLVFVLFVSVYFVTIVYGILSL